tara:strand:+ start:1388 stop:1783 length:396 start_codon:yes stop_codon:yes gene_type:complete
MSYALLWNFDLEIAVTDFNFQHGGVGLPVKDITWFESSQYGVHTPDSNKKNNMLIKIETLWEIYGEGKMLTVDPFYNYESNYRTVPGVVDPKKSNSINVLLEPYDDTILINKGDVACLFIPLNFEDINIVI